MAAGIAFSKGVEHASYAERNGKINAAHGGGIGEIPNEKGIEA
jgi:hypothetical protein